MRTKNTTLTKTAPIAYASGVKQKNRVFRMDDETYSSLTSLSTYFGMKRAAVLRLFIMEAYTRHRRAGHI
jgi:hypothetical protein